MATEVPASLKQADVNIWKCATKGAQLQAVKPIVAYWCEYWVVNQVLAKSLHTTNDEILAYTTTLMDKLENTKSAYADEEAVTDDTMAQAYVENFAQETLDRAERVVKANKVTMQTATTFDAAASFFHLSNIWGTPEPATLQKIKYAKWNAARIAKALKEGKDPNESNPHHDQPQVQPNPTPSGSHAQTHPLGSPPAGASQPRPATVEDAPDASSPPGWALPARIDLPAPSPLAPPPMEFPGHPNPTPYDAQSLPSPVSPPPPHQAAGYQSPPPPSIVPHHSSPPMHPPMHPPQPTSSWQTPAATPPVSVPPPVWAGPSPASSLQPSISSSPAFAPALPPPNFAPSPLQAVSAVAPPPMATSMPMAQPAYGARPMAPQGYPAPEALAGSRVVVDEAAMVGAQKHAKWAVSALNFEDVPTAIRELRRALEMLGAS